MSYTLRGRLESRLAAALGPLLAAGALTAWLHVWWPVELALIMVAVGLACDAVLYHRLLAYQPGWAALPLGLLELGLVIATAEAIGIMAPLRPALALFAGAWLLSQLLGHAVLPLLRLSYAEDGGELGRAGAVVIGAVAGFTAAAGGLAWATQPPTVYLSGVHQGPMVITRTETLVGRPGAVVEGGLVIKADNVVVRGLTVVGGNDGVTVDGATGVHLDDVHVRGAKLDGFHIRRAQVMISDCSVAGLRSPYAQGIDISFSFDLPTSMVERCTVTGGQEGIVADSAHVEVRDNDVTATTMRGITINEMAMGTVEENRVHGALGIGILCADQSECLIAGNLVTGTRPDLGSTDLTRRGYAIVAHSSSTAYVLDNRLSGNPFRLGAFVNGVIRHGSNGFHDTMTM
jgi:Right handed beta helix region